MEELTRILWEMFGTKKMRKKDLPMTGRKRIMHILPLVINALNNEKRQRMLAFLLKNRDADFSFARIKEEFSPINNKALSNHLQILQKAWLIERTVDLPNPKIQENPYHSFYQISDFGFKVLGWLAAFLVMVEKDYLSKDN